MRKENTPASPPHPRTHPPRMATPRPEDHADNSGGPIMLRVYWAKRPKCVGLTGRSPPNALVLLGQARPTRVVHTVLGSRPVTWRTLSGHTSPRQHLFCCWRTLARTALALALCSVCVSQVARMVEAFLQGGVQWTGPATPLSCATDRPHRHATGLCWRRYCPAAAFSRGLSARGSDGTR